MPFALIPTIASAFSVIGITGTAATVGAYIVVTALSLAASYALNAYMATRRQKASPQQQTVKQAVPPRLLVYGRDKVGGALVFYETFGGILNQVQYHCEGPIDAIESYWLNDSACGSPFSAVAPWTGHVFAVSNLGTTSQTAFASLVASSNGQWTSAHKLTGCACTYMTAISAGEKKNPKVYSGGVPQLRVVLRGQADIYDPRDGGTRWTENPALIIRDYLVRRVQITVNGVSRMERVGFGIDPSRIDEASFIAFANVCDQTMNKADGTTEPRYRVSASIDLATSEPRAVLASLLRACDGEIYPTQDGKVAIRGGVYTAPTAALGEDDVIAFDYSNGGDPATDFNRLKITYKEPNDFQPAEGQPWDNTTDQAERGVIQREFDAQNVPSHTQARRLARISMMRGTSRHRITITVRYGAALRLWGERNFTFTLAELGLTSAPFFIEKITLSPDTMTGVVEASSEDSTAYDWTTSLDGTPPITGTSVPTAVVIPSAPTPTLSIDWRSVNYSTQVAVLEASIPVEDLFESRYQYREAGATEWLTLPTQEGGSGILSPASDGVTYQVRAAYATSTDDVGGWSAYASISVVSNSTPPASSGSGLSVSGSTTATVSWTTPNDVNLAFSRVYRSTTNTFSTATVVGTSYAAAGASTSVVVTGLATGTTYYFWVRAFNASGIGATAPIGSVSLTP